jgi:hypothetical protein
MYIHSGDILARMQTNATGIPVFMRKAGNRHTGLFSSYGFIRGMAYMNDMRFLSNELLEEAGKLLKDATITGNENIRKSAGSTDICLRESAMTNAMNMTPASEDAQSMMMSDTSDGSGRARDKRGPFANVGERAVVRASHPGFRQMQVAVRTTANRGKKTRHGRGGYIN